MFVPYLFITLLFFILITLPLGVCSLAAWLLRQWPLWATGFRWTGIVISVIIALVFLVGLTWGWRQITVTKFRFAHTSVPAAFDGYRIIQLSDFHLGTLTGHPETVQHIVDSVNALQPDLIVFTGDLVNLHAEEEREFHEILRGLHAKDGVVSVMGNHDYMMYAYNRSHNVQAGAGISRAQLADIRQLQEAERDLGWHLLLNDHHILHRGEDSIAIVGVENDGDGKHFPQYGDLDKAQRGLPEGIFKVLLSHDPTHWRRTVLPTTDIPLQLSGHTHAMQFMVFGWSPSRWAYSEWRGPYTVYPTGDDGRPTTGASSTKSTHRTLFVSSGIGEVAVPFRFGAWPEIVEITLHK